MSVIGSSISLSLPDRWIKDLRANVRGQRRAGMTLAKLDDAVRRVLCTAGLGIEPNVATMLMPFGNGSNESETRRMPRR